MSKPLTSRIKGAFILRRGRRFYKVITTRSAEGNWWMFECKDIETKQNHVFKYQMLGMLEALDAAARVTREPKDILLMDLDNQGKWKIMTRDQMDKALKAH